MTVDFGRAAADYCRHRAGFPEAFFARIESKDLIWAGARLLDLGTGTGSIARGMARRGCVTFALDLAPQLLSQARRLDVEAGAHTAYFLARAEQCAVAEGSFDIVTAGQCWHWFDGPRTAREIARILIPDGAIIIAHFDWLPRAGNVVAATEALITRHNLAWSLGGGDGFYPAWLNHLGEAGFVDLESFSFDLDVTYSHEAWRGRVRASAGVAASLAEARVRAFDKDLEQLLRDSFPADPLEVPHRVFVALGRNQARK
ncbi:MAG: methyltransferase domain-containing protein [Chloroflexi bacterium]|nr:methyltransferase domain-containing protein [Chloroflexota bacterium]